MTREWVKSWRGPRISQSPLSFSCQVSARWSTSTRCRAQASSLCPSAESRAASRASITSPTTSVWRWRDGRVADPHRSRAGVPGQPVDGPLGQAPRAVDGVHDLEVGGVAGHGPEQPVAPEPRLVGRARLDQRVDREGGVAQPAVAVVPVALAAEVLGQRGGRGRHDPAGLGVGHQVQGQQRAPYVVGVRHAGEVAAATPRSRTRRSSRRRGSGGGRACAGETGARWSTRSAPGPRGRRSRRRGGGPTGGADAVRAGPACRGRRRR